MFTCIVSLTAISHVLTRSKGVLGWSAKTLQRNLRMFNTCNACVIMATALFTIITAIVQAPTFTTVVNSAYILYVPP